MIERRVVWAAIAVLLAFGAQTARAESVFGLNLLGERMDNGDVRAVALGGPVHILDDSLGVLQQNPAMLGGLNRVTFGASQLFESDANSSDAGDERNVASKFTSFAFAFPLMDWFTVGLSYRGQYDPDGQFTRFQTSSTGEGYREEFIRSGGLNSYRLAVGRDVSRFVRAGAYFSYETGSLEKRWNTIFDDPAQAPAFSIQDRTLTGNGWGAGLVVRPLAGVMVGAVYEAEIDYDVEVDELYTNSAASGSYDEDMVLPARWTVSAHWQGEDFAVYAGGSIRDFEKFEGLGFPPDRLRREETASLGVEYLRGAPLFGRRFPLRLSITWERLPYTMPEGEAIQRLVAGIGTGLQLSDGRGKLDFALQAGQIGSRDTNGLQTTVLRFFVGVSGAEIWKRKRESAY